MRKRYVLYLFSLLSILMVGGVELNAQQKESEQTVKLVGVVIDSVSMEPVAFSTVAVTPLDNTTKKEPLRQVTDDMGQFTIALPASARYQVETSFVGKRSSKRILARKEIRRGMVIKFYMTDDVQELQGVTVSAARPLVRLAPDRIAYDVKNDPLSSSQNLREMLRKVPLVTIDGEGNLQIKGSANYQIHLNGKPSTMLSSNPKEVLRSIPASSIKKIEVITEPGVKYDAEGTSAILNIITEDDHSLEGLMGTVSMTASYPWGVTPSIYLTGKAGKLGFSAFYVHYDGTVNPHKQIIERTTSKMKTLNEGETSTYTRGDHGSFMLSYDINPKNLLTANVDFSLYNAKSVIKSRGQEWQLSDLATRTALSRDSIANKIFGGSLEAGLNYQHSTSLEDELLTLSYLYKRSPSNNSADMSVSIFNPATEALNMTMLQRSNTNSAMNEHTAQIDYTRPFGKEHYIEAGAKYIYRLGYGLPSYEHWDASTKSWASGGIFGQTDPFSSSSMTYHQGILGVYGSYRWVREKYSVQAGLRAEYGTYNVEYSHKDVAEVNRKFLDWVPQITLGYNPSQSSQFKLSYLFNVRRPGIEQINPYKQQTNPYNVSYGNADLSNERMHTLSLSYNFFSPKWVVNTSLSSGYCDNAINSYMFADPKNPKLYHQTWGNIGQKKSIGLSLFANYNPLAWLRFYSNANLSYVINDATGLKALDGKSDASSKVSGWGGMAYMGSVVTLPAKFIVGVNAGYFMQEPTLNSFNMSGYWYNLSLSKAFFKESLNISAFVNNPFFHERTMTSYLRGPEMNGTLQVIGSQFMGGISFSYSFGKLSSEIRTSKRTIQNEDMIESSNKGNAQGGANQGQGAGPR